VPKAELLLLAHRYQVHHVRHCANSAKVLNVTTRLKDRLEIGGDVEVIFNGALMFARHQDDALNPRSDRFLNGVLDCGTINDRE
jgi:hypothetical protein